MAKKKARKTRPIVIGHLEKIGSRVFDDYRRQITDMIKGHYGVYALYRRDKLYYIGMATDFRRRLNKHLSDRLKGKWNQFSLYLIRKTEHLREVESLLLRITTPEGNRILGKLRRSVDLRPQLKRLMTEGSRQVIEDILEGSKASKKKVKKSRRKIWKRGVERPLRGAFAGGKMLYATYKGKEYKAWLDPRGVIIFNKRRYDTPSGAGKAVRKKGTNGWWFWRYKEASGKLRSINHLRK